MRLGILSQTLELRMGGATCCNTPAALHCLWDTSQGIRGGGGGVQMKKRPADSLPQQPPLLPRISLHPSFKEGGGEITGGGENKRGFGGTRGRFFSHTPGLSLQSCSL